MHPRAFLDANIPIYAAGRPHPLKAPAVRVLTLAAEHPEAFITDVEVVQELLHRYTALRLWDPGREVVAHFLALMEGRIEAVVVGDVREAVELADEHRDVAARDLVHAAVMLRVGADYIVTADRDFDRIRGVTRLLPAAVDEWSGSLLR